jgi:hypothetical protein
LTHEKNLYREAFKILRNNKKASRHTEEKRLRHLRIIGMIGRRICNHGLRQMGQVLRMLREGGNEHHHQEVHHQYQKKAFIQRLLDKDKRIMGMGWNKLVEQYKLARSHAKEMMRFVIKSLKDGDSRKMFQAYNTLVHRANKLHGVGFEN